MKRRAAIYCRISQDREGAGLGVERQRADCEALSSRLGWPIVAVHTDNDLSAYSGKARPGYQALLGDLDAGSANAVLAWHTDRLHRSPRELEDYVALCERKNVITQTVKAGELDLATPSGRAVARTLGAWARFESEHKSDRIKRAHQQAAADGRWRGGARPFGYQADAVTLHPVEAPAIQSAYKELLAGASMRSIFRGWNDAGLTSVSGKPWAHATFRQMMLRPRNYGASVYRGEVLGVGAWQPLVDEATWRGAHALITDHSRAGGSNRARWLLSGIALCGVCGNTVKIGTGGSRNGDTWKVYRCKGGEHLGRRADYCDELVSGVISARLSAPDAEDLLVDDTDTDAEAGMLQAAALRARIEEAVGLFGEGVLSAAQLRTTKRQLEEQLADAEQTLASRNRHALFGAVVGVKAPQRWKALDIDRQRAIVAEMLTITLLPVPPQMQRRFHPETVQLEWKA